jgi:hypothetical protein
MILALTIPLVLVLFEADTQCAQASQKSSEDILLEIMDLHTELVTNETFLAQAKMLGAYLEAAQPLEEAKKIKIYAKVLGILAKIKDSKVHIALSPDETESSIEDKNFEGEQAGKTIYEPGAALLEIFKIDTEKQEIPDLPVIRTYWRHDLDWAGDFPLPGRISEIGGRDSSYFAKFSFYYEAKQSGKYGFTILHNQSNACGLTIGGVDVVVAKPNASSAQGVCNLKKGFHRIEFGVGKPETLWIASNTGSFQVKILTPGAFDAVPLTKDMMLLKKE